MSSVSNNSLVVGVDAQPRGLAVAQLHLETGAFISVEWVPTGGARLEEKVYLAYEAAHEVAELLQPCITVVELPTAVTSSSTMSLWGICGAVLSAFYPYSLIVEGIVPTSWKKYSGLNIYAKEQGRTSKNGIIEKLFIKEAIIALVPNVPSDLTPVDLYDSIAIAKAGYERNNERVKKTPVH
jgi:hypothetical protein